MAVAGRATGFYRYVRTVEKLAIESEKCIKSASLTGITWFTPDRYDTQSEAQMYLALPARPDHRVGPIPADEMPAFDHARLRVVQPFGGQPGGGLECATTDELHLFDLFALQ